MKIKVINPNTTMEMTEGIGEAARSVARAGTEIVAVSPEFGPASIESYYDEQVAACGVLDEVRKGESEGVDAYVIACYGDPGLHAAREMTEKPVVGIAEASFYIASMVAARFSVVSVIPRVRTLLEEMVHGYGMTERIVAIRTTPLYVLDIERDPEGSMEKLRDEVAALGGGGRRRGSLPRLRRLRALRGRARSRARGAGPRRCGLRHQAG